MVFSIKSYSVTNFWKHLTFYNNNFTITARLFDVLCMDLLFSFCFCLILLYTFYISIFWRFTFDGGWWFKMFNATFNNISVISWWSVLLVEETGVSIENHRPVVSHWQTLSHNVIHLAVIEIQTHNINGDRHLLHR